MKIDKSEILKYIIEDIMDKNLLKNISAVIDESIKELKIEVADNKISPLDAEKIVRHIQDSDRFKELIAEAIGKEQTTVKTSGNGKFWLGMILAGGLAYGGYDMFLERYSVEQEYAFMSACVGEHGYFRSKEQCINRLKKCLKDDKKFSECY